MRFDERLRRLEELEGAHEEAESGADVLCITRADWETLQSPTTDATTRQTIGQRYGVDVDRFAGKVLIDVCVCWSGRSCPVCEET